MGIIVVKPNWKIDIDQVGSLSIPPFQCSVMVARTGVVQNIAREIRSFLWQGGKSNNKKIHLINWKIVRAPKNRWGLGIKGPTLMNIAMGAKLIWRLITSKLDWWKKIIWKKYLQGNWKRCIESIVENQKGSHIWRLIKSVAPLIQSKLTLIPGDGKQISIWEDSIMGKKALSHRSELRSLKLYGWMVRTLKLCMIYQSVQQAQIAGWDGKAP